MAKPTAYVVKQLVYDKKGMRNETAGDLEALVTHHPYANRNARMVDGHLHGVENPKRRSHGCVGGELQEVELARTDEYGSLKTHQVLLVKDFILEGPGGNRYVDVPSPVSGHVGRVDRANAMVEIHDREGGEVIARVRHLDPIVANKGDEVVYGQSLGTQGNAGLRLPPGKSIHVHMEVDTRYYQHMDAYMRDLASGRLPVQAEYRRAVPPPVVVDDGIQRLGERGENVAAVQKALNAAGLRARDGSPIEVDGIYGPDMQGAVRAFQKAHGLPDTGDIDIPTRNAARRTLSQQDVSRDPGEVRPEAGARTVRADEPGHPGFGAFNRIHEWVRGMGQWNEEQSRNVAAALYAQQAADPLVRQVDQVTGGLGRDGAQNVFAVYRPYGDKEPCFHVHVDGRTAAHVPADGSFERAEQMTQQRLQEEMQQGRHMAAGPRVMG